MPKACFKGKFLVKDKSKLSYLSIESLQFNSNKVKKGHSHL